VWIVDSEGFLSYRRIGKKKPKAELEKREQFFFGFSPTVLGFVGEKKKLFPVFFFLWSFGFLFFNSPSYSIAKDSIGLMLIWVVVGP